MEAKAEIEKKALGEGALGRLLKGANPKARASEIIIEGEITPSKGSLIKRFPIDPDYKLEFTIIPTGKAKHHVIKVAMINKVTELMKKFQQSHLF